jgi:hypothetical protein
MLFDQKSEGFSMPKTVVPKVRAGLARVPSTDF